MSIKKFIFFFFFFSGCISIPVEISARSTGTSPIEYRSPDKEKLDKYLTDDDFNYERPGASSVFEPWERFKKWLANLLRKAFGNAPSAETVLNFFYIIATLVIIWLVMKLVGGDINTVFRKSRPSKPVNYQINEENIRNIDFEKKMNVARSSGQWRLLIRLQYLFILKGLADKGMVEIKGGKTNHDYLYELGNSPLKPSMLLLSRIFEYTWYGHFEVKPATLAEADRQFSDLKNRLGR